VPAQRTKVEIPEPPARGDEGEPPQIRHRHQDIARPHTPIHGNAAPIGKGFSRTVKARDIVGGYVVLPPRLSSCLGPATQVKVDLAENATVLSFDSSNRRLVGLTDWFRKSAIEPGDQIKFHLLRVDPPEIRIWTEWEKHLNYILRCPAEDFRWQHLPIRDCLIKVFADHQEPMHYRSLYSQISRHRELVVGSVIATLSRHRGVLFLHRGSGRWSRLQSHAVSDPRLFPSRQVPREETAPHEISDGIWKIVAEIEEGDVVYGLLKRTRDSLSFVQICQKIAEARGIDWHELQHTGFLNAEDERLKRLDNGHFALREWFDDPVWPPARASSEIDIAAEKESIAPPIGTCAESPPPQMVQARLLWKMWTVVLRMLECLIRWAKG